MEGGPGSPPSLICPSPDVFPIVVIYLFRTPDSSRPLSVRQMAVTLGKVINLADSGHIPRAHDVRGVAASLAFLRTHSLGRVRHGDLWSTALAFVSRSLHPTVADAPCATLGLRPNH